MAKMQAIRFNDFMDGNYKQKESVYVKKNFDVKACTVYINPLLFLDPAICLIGGGILALATYEKYLERTGNIDIVIKIQKVTRVILPAIVWGYLIYALITLPIMGWIV
ncbi:hypothetical protein [Bacillus taeanensis]|uniref:Uncharacterized protein n=1 Tax=Bacillus taeanensis TaxID=273032 RepID=A0A366XWE4_9BACI|nr:hypothetical protein [Bacillus taeanensis]RBW69475.1 hypothetical protein DS031_11160 [Bacillus taeanensis]